MSEICNHDIADKDTAIADGLCPLCLVQRVAELEETNRWIPVGERLPERGYRVLLYDAKSQYMFTGELDHMGGRKEPVFEIYRASDCGYFSREITHWRPLPEPPTKDGQP
jgi:hypothetical protein